MERVNIRLGDEYKVEVGRERLKIHRARVSAEGDPTMVYKLLKKALDICQGYTQER